MKIKADFSEAYEATKKLGQIFPEIEKFGRRWIAEADRELKKSARDMRKTFWRKTGLLARSVAGRVWKRLKSLNFVIGSGVFAQQAPYAVIQDRGGTIRAKNKMLTIPFEGVRGWAREYDTFCIKSKKTGSTILMDKSTKRPLFTLKSEVKIPASLWFTNVIERKKAELFDKLNAEGLIRDLRVEK